MVCSCDSCVGRETVTHHVCNLLSQAPPIPALHHRWPARRCSREHVAAVLLDGHKGWVPRELFVRIYAHPSLPSAVLATAPHCDKCDTRSARRTLSLHACMPLTWLSRRLYAQVRTQVFLALTRHTCTQAHAWRWTRPPAPLKRARARFALCLCVACTPHTTPHHAHHTTAFPASSPQHTPDGAHSAVLSCGRK